MRTFTTASAALALIALSQGAPAGANAANENPPASVVRTLAAIQADAAAIAAGRYKTTADLREPAHRIGYAWSQVAPSLIGRGSVMVEANLAKTSIETLEREWETPGKAQADAKTVASMVADLTDVTREHAADATPK